MILGGRSVPAVVANGFTVAETAVLAVLAHEHKRRGFSALTIGELAYLANTCRTVVHNTLRLAEARGVISVDRLPHRPRPEPVERS